MLRQQPPQLVADGPLYLAAKEHGGQRQRTGNLDELLADDERPADIQPARQKAEVEPVIAPLAAHIADVGRIVALHAVEKTLDPRPRRLLAQIVRDRHAVGRHSTHPRGESASNSLCDSRSTCRPRQSAAFRWRQWPLALGKLGRDNSAATSSYAA